MNYEETCEYLNTLNKLGSVPGLSAITELLRRLGNPQDHTRFVHIAGTNGKGSVGSFICSVLMEAGYKTGRYLSPAVWEPLEIIKLNDTDISRDDFTETVSIVKKACDEMLSETGVHPTRFEIETAVAFLFFYKKNCDIAVIECGMGGLLDATNVVMNTDCAVITSVSRDHMNVLGDNVLTIAAQKAGIIKPGAAVVCADDPETRPVIEKYGVDHGMISFTAVSQNDVHIVSASLENGIIFDYKNHRNLLIKTSGIYQSLNAAIAVAACEALRTKYKISDENIRNGIASAKWNGRFQMLGKNPYFIIDGAHNDDGATALSESINTYFPGCKVTFILGVFKDKEYDKIIDHIISQAKAVITIQTPQNPRALPAKKLAEYVKKYYYIPVYDYENINDAICKAFDITEQDGVIIACGSLSHLRHVTDGYNKLKGGRHD